MNGWRKLQAGTERKNVTAQRWRYIGPVVEGNVGDNSVSSYRLRASETQQLSCVPMAYATPICYLYGVARGRLATHPSNTAGRIMTKLDLMLQQWRMAG